MFQKGSSTTRRAFILQSAKAAGALTLLHACGQSIKSLQSPIKQDAISRLQQNFSGQIILPAEQEYETARRVLFMNPQNNKHPALVARCADETDVKRCIDFARQQELEIAVRSGNHSFLGWGTCEKGMVIDLSKIKSVSIDPIKQTALVTTGNTAGEILAAAAQHGLAPVMGQCGSVGAGFILGGGLGWLSGKHGAGCDNLLSARVITADGHTVTANESNNQDLFWAIRGGGGNFGVATSFELKLYPLKAVLTGNFVYPISKARSMLRLFREFMLNGPDELQADCSIVAGGGGTIIFNFVYSGDLEKGEELLDVFRKYETPNGATIKRQPFSDIYKSEAGDGASPFLFRSVKGAYIDQLSEEVIDVLLERLSQGPPSSEVLFIVNHFMHGEVCCVAPDVTAFELRKPGAAHLVIFAQWKEAAQWPACLEWQNKTVERLQPYSSERIYANYMSSQQASAAKRVYGTNYPRLVALKKKYDPQNIFHLNQNVKPK